MIVAIDGPAGGGKSSLAKLVSKEFGFFNLNSGNFYRAVALASIRKSISLEQKDRLIELASSLKLEIINGKLHLDGEDVEDLLHKDDVNSIVSPLSSIVKIREILNERIQMICSKIDVVAEGRDMTTVVFPNAELKYYLDASIEERAKRRFEQGVSERSFDEIKADIEKRDHNDMNKEQGSLKISEDAIYLDTSDLTLEQVCEKVFRKINMLNK